MAHDHAYKLLFSHPQMVADLLRGFVREAWVQQLDFATLEPVSGHYVSDKHEMSYVNIQSSVFHRFQCIINYRLPCCFYAKCL